MSISMLLARFGATLVMVAWASPLLAQSMWRDYDYPFENNENPGSYFGIRQAELSLSPRELVLLALEKDCVIDPPAGTTPCDEATMFVITDAIVKIAAQQHRDPIPGRVFLPNVPDRDDYIEEAMTGLQREIENFLGGGEGNEFGYPSAIEGTVETICGPLAYSFSTSVGYSYRRDADGELADYPKVELTVRLGISGTCDCREVNGEQIRDIRYGYQGILELGFFAEDEIEWSPGFAICRNTSSCDCAIPAEADAFPGRESDPLGWVLSWDSPVWCTYGGGGMTLLPPGYTPSPTTPFPAPFPPAGPPVSPDEDDDSGAPMAGGDRPPVPPAESGDSEVPGEQGGGLPPAPPAGTPVGTPTAGAGTLPPTDGGESDPPDDSDTPDEQDPPVPRVELTFKATSAALAQGTGVMGAGATQIQLNTGDPAQVAGDPGAQPDDSGSSEGALNTTTDEEGNATLMVPVAVAAAIGRTLIEFGVTAYTGRVLAFDGLVDAAGVLPDALLPYAQPALTLAGNTYIPLLMPEASLPGLQGAIDSAGATQVEVNVCIDPKPLSDPYFGTSGSWQQPYPDQWAIQRVGFTDDEDSAWDRVQSEAEPVIVAVIDSGLDWNHREIRWDSLWRNPGEIAANGIDDDGNGYVDDTIGWDFWDNDRKPWDNDGHGTFVAGVLFADPDNGEGIAGITRHARLMVLKAMNAFGHTRASNVAQAIKYAADHGARVINLSLGGPGESTVVREAITYAHARGAVVVVAAGNEAVPAEETSVAALPNALTVAAIGYDDRRSVYSNYGTGVDLAAPGDDVLSLRARRTDLLKNIPGVDYTAESAFVGDDRRYYRASGTSFAAPIVAGVAALVLAKHPDLSADQVMRVLKQSARDVETPGVDHFTGYGVVDARAALEADPDFFIEAAIAGVGVANRDGEQVLLVNGSMDSDRFRRATVSIGKGEDPSAWDEVAQLKRPVDGELAAIPATRFAGSKVWIIRLEVQRKGGRVREFRFRLALG